MSLLRRSFVWRPLLVLTITFAIMGSLALGLVGSRPASAGFPVATLAGMGMILNEMVERQTDGTMDDSYDAWNP